MDAPGQARAGNVVENDTIQLYPPKFKNMYRAWMENVRDWCISPPAVVGPADSGLLHAGWHASWWPSPKHEALEQAQHEKRQSPLTEADLTPGRGRARYLVFVVAVAHFGVRWTSKTPTMPTSTISTRPTTS
ncbi:MAG: hypothetical protein WKG07_33745 [Hymenobacter sp.]